MLEFGAFWKDSILTVIRPWPYFTNAYSYTSWVLAQNGFLLYLACLVRFLFMTQYLSKYNVHPENFHSRIMFREEPPAPQKLMST
jgi:hypothetical protein